MEISDFNMPIHFTGEVLAELHGKVSEDEPTRLAALPGVQVIAHENALAMAQKTGKL